MLTATLVTLAATPFVAVGALLVFRALTAAPGTGRHRVNPGVDQYRPRPAGPVHSDCVSIPGPVDPADTAVTNVRDMAVPVPLVWRQEPLDQEKILAILDEKTREVTRAA